MQKDEKILKLTPGDKSREIIDMLNACKVLVGLAPKIASLKRCYFKAYISEGFTPEQAIELCKNIAVI